MNNPYEVLGIPNNSSNEVIKSAFKSLAKVTHPDVNGGKEQMTAKFREAAEAYAILMDPVQKEYWNSNQNDESQQQTTDNPSSDDISVRTIATNIEMYIHSLYEQVGPYKNEAKKSVFVGMAWLVGGLVVTFGSYAIALSNGGGTYFVAWGAILFGGLQAVKSFFNYIKINSAITKAKVEMWDSFK